MKSLNVMEKSLLVNSGFLIERSNVMKKSLLVTILCLGIVVGAVNAVLIDEDVYYWDGQTPAASGSGYLGSGFRTAQNPGETPTVATINGLSGDTDYVVWVRAWAKVGGIQAIRSIITANSGADKLGQYITHETGFSTNDWYWQKAGIIHTPAGVTSIDYAIHQAYRGSDWECADQVRLSDDLNYEPTENKLANQGGVFIDTYDMDGYWGKYTSSKDIGKGYIAGPMPGLSWYNDLGGFSPNTTYYVWVRAGMGEDNKARNIRTTVSDDSGTLLSAVSHDGKYGPGELPGGSGWYWEQIGSFTTGTDTSLDFTVSVGAGHDPSVWKSIDAIYLTTDPSYSPIYGWVIPEPATIGLLGLGVIGLLRKK